MPIEKVKNEDGSEWTPITVCAEDFLRIAIMTRKLSVAVRNGEFSKAEAAEHIKYISEEMADMIEGGLEEAGMDPAECYQFCEDVGDELNKNIAEGIRNG